MNLSAFTGLIGIAVILGLAYLCSRDRRRINWRLVISGLALQWVLALFVLKVPFGQALFHGITEGINQLLSFGDEGAKFVFGPLIAKPMIMDQLFGPGGSFIFAFKIVPTIIFVATLASIAYHVGLMQHIVQAVAWVMAKLMGVSGAEALSNVASIFVGQIEAQLLIKPYLETMTRSEMLAVMAGSMACIAGATMAVYIQMGVNATYLLTASLMAAPGALVVAKMLYPETQVSPTMGKIKLEVEHDTVNLIDAAAKGASDGLKIGLQVVTMLIGFLGLVALLDWIIAQLGLGLANLTGWTGSFAGLSLQHLGIKQILGTLFSSIAFLLGVPFNEARTVGGLMGTKMVLNEFVAYTDLLGLQQQAAAGAVATLSPKATVIAVFALCGFANFGSVAMQIGGIGAMVPRRKAELAKLGMRAMICGTMASYISSAIAGILQSI